jgi:hypothetical protein
MGMCCFLEKVSQYPFDYNIFFVRFSIMLLARTLATIAQAEAGKQEEVMQKFMSLIHSVADEKSNICHKLMGEQFTSQIEVLRVSLDCCHFGDNRPSGSWP